MFVGAFFILAKTWRQPRCPSTGRWINLVHSDNGYYLVLKRSWTIKKAECRRIDAFELWCWRTLESPLDRKVIQPVHPKGDQSWVFIGRTDAEAETPTLWPPDAKS